MKEETLKTTIRVPRDLWAKVRGKAVEDGKTTQMVIQILLKRWVEGKLRLEENPKRKLKRVRNGS
jgi:hypothetical protein